MSYDKDLICIAERDSFKMSENGENNFFIFFYYDLKKNHIHILAKIHLSRLDLAVQL